MMMLGMCAALRQRYEVKSNRESGEGRPDLILLARGNGCHSIILEFKYTKDPKEDLEALAEKGICQIRKKKYGIEPRRSLSIQSVLRTAEKKQR